MHKIITYIITIPRKQKVMAFKAVLFFAFMLCGFYWYKIDLTKENVIVFFQGGDIQRSLRD